jgi:hypothetical protein
MSKTLRLRTKEYQGVPESDVKSLRKNGAIRKQTKMTPYQPNKERI